MRLLPNNMLYLIGGSILLAVILISCEEALKERAERGDYFPLDPQSRWEYSYAHTYGCCSDSGLVIRDTMHLRVEEALFVDGTFYKFLDDHNLTCKMVRKIGNQYLESPAYSPEFMFLDPTMPVGFCWTSDSVSQDKLEVTGVNLTKTVNGNTYSPVIEVKQTRILPDDQGQPIVFSTTYHYYAKDVGLIYSITTYGEAGQESTIVNTLLRFWKE